MRAAAVLVLLLAAVGALGAPRVTTELHTAWPATPLLLEAWSVVGDASYEKGTTASEREE